MPLFIKLTALIPQSNLFSYFKNNIINSEPCLPQTNGRISMVSPSPTQSSALLPKGSHVAEPHIFYSTCFPSIGNDILVLVVLTF